MRKLGFYASRSRRTKNRSVTRWSAHQQQSTTKHILTTTVSGISEFSTCAYMQLFKFLDGHVPTFRHHSGAYICQMPDHRLSTLAKGTPTESRYHWFGVKLIPVGRIVERYPKTQKCCFWIGLRSCYKIPEVFTIAPVLTSTLAFYRRNRGDPSSLYRT